MSSTTHSEQPVIQAEHRGGFDAQCAVIGAGAAGLAAGKALADRGVSFDWFEKGSMVGGLWQITNDNGAVAAYDSLHLNSSRPLTQFPSFPMPEDWPDYPSHTLIAEYFDAFADKYHLRERITFKTQVLNVEPIPGRGLPGTDGWAVTTDDGQVRFYEHVIVANGHHSTPKIPEFPGRFTGRTMHAHDYRNPKIFQGKRVLVLGVGNSGMDIACDSCRVSATTFLATRHGVHVLPKYAFGRPIDQLSHPLTAYLPVPVERSIYELLVRFSAGRPEDRGLPKPDHRLLEAHPTVSAELYDRVGHGDIIMKPTIERFDGRTVEFADGSREEIDLLVYATGYRVTLPFISGDLIDPEDNKMPLYERIVSPDLPGLWFCGFIQTVGSGIPLYEYQALWIGDVITGAAQLPSPGEMREWIDHDQDEMAKRYIRSTRHTMQVDYWRYIKAMKGLREHGRAQSLVRRVRSLVRV